MRDTDVRPALTEAVAALVGERPHVLVPEVGVRWNVPARVDAMLVADRIYGFEIKSDVDSLGRLPRQIEAYGAVVERAVLVVGERHRVHASALVPDWWAIWTAQWQDNQVIIRKCRRGALNPDVNPHAVASFLSRKELTTELQQRGRGRLSSLTVEDLREQVVRVAGRSGTLALARRALLSRPDWKSRCLLAA